MGMFIIIGDSMSIIVGFIIILAIYLYSIRKYRIADILFILLLLHYILKINWLEVFNYKIIVYFIIGLLLSQYIMKIFSKIFFKNYIIEGRYALKISLKNLLTSFYEEIVWRHLMVYFLSIVLSSLLSNYLLVLSLSASISLFSFLLIHDFNSRRQLFEFTIFGFILTVTSIFFPGMNVGLHLGRNCFLSNKNGDEV